MGPSQVADGAWGQGLAVLTDGNRTKGVIGVKLWWCQVRVRREGRGSCTPGAAASPSHLKKGHGSGHVALPAVRVLLSVHCAADSHWVALPFSDCCGCF